MTSPLLLKDEIFISYAHADNKLLRGQAQGLGSRDRKRGKGLLFSSGLLMTERDFASAQTAF